MKESHIHGHCEYPNESPSPCVVFSWAPVQIARETTGGATELSLQEELLREMQVVGRVLLLPLRVCCSLHTKAMQWATDLGKSCSTHDSSAGQFLLKIFPLAWPRLSEPLFSLRPLLLSNPYFPLSFHRCQPYITFWIAYSCSFSPLSPTGISLNMPNTSNSILVSISQTPKTDMKCIIQKSQLVPQDWGKYSFCFIFN